MSPDQKARVSVLISPVPFEADSIDTLLRLMALATNNDESDLAQHIKGLGIGSNQYERDGHMVTVEFLSGEVVERRNKKALLAEQMTTVEHPSEEFCDATGRLLYIPIELKLRGTQLSVGLEVQRCNDHPQHDPTLEEVMNSLRVLRDE